VSSPRLAYTTCSRLPEGDEDAPAVFAALAARGVAASIEVWDDASVDWSTYDLVVVRSTWDWWDRRDDFVRWARSVPRLANPAPMIEWSTDKRYLADLPHGVPTAFWEAGAPAPGLPPAQRWIVKPTVSAGAYLTFATSDPAAAVEEIHAAGKTAMVQPYLDGIDERGETAVIYFGGEYSHTVRKAPVLTSPRGEDGKYPVDQLAPRTPTAAERRVADEVLAASPGGWTYARVDLVPGPDGEPLLLELEVAEPALFLAYDEGAVDRFAEALAAATLAS
jgi:hypothetical protein